MKLIKIILVLILFAFLLIVAHLNQNPVEVGYFYGKHLYNVPLFAVIFASILAGMVIAGLISISDQLKKKFTIRQLNQKIGRLEGEIKSLRSMQISEGFEAEPEKPIDMA